MEATTTLTMLSESASDFSTSTAPSTSSTICAVTHDSRSSTYLASDEKSTNSQNDHDGGSQASTHVNSSHAWASDDKLEKGVSLDSKLNANIDSNAGRERDLGFAFPNSFLANGLLFDPYLDSSLWETVKPEPEDGRCMERSLTLRSLVIGSLVGCLGAAIYQVYVLKPVFAVVNNTFLIVVAYIGGSFWAAVLPKAPSRGEQNVEKRRKDEASRSFGDRILCVINPGPFSLGEHAISSMIAMAAANGSLAVQTLSVQYLYYDTQVDLLAASLFIFSTTCFGCALAGLFRHFTVKPKGLIYPSVTIPVVPPLSLLRGEPTTSLPNAHADVKPVFHAEPDSDRQWLSKGFSFTFWTTFIYEIFPAYIFPLLNGINIFCLASQTSTSQILQDAFTSLFGGASGNEGLGLFSVSFDWQFIGSSFQGYALCYCATMGIYYSNIWNAFNLPILATTIFSPNGTVYDHTAIMDENFNIIPEAIREQGAPGLTGSFLWANIASNLGVGSLIAHALWFIGPRLLFPFMYRGSKEGKAPRFTVVLRHPYISQMPYMLALIAGTIAFPLANSLNAYLGHWMLPMHVAKMVGSLVLPGNPLGILYFSTWSESAVSNGMYFTSQLKLGQYLKIPSRVILFTQIWGLLLATMARVIEHQQEAFTSPIGTNIWNGQVPQILNSEVVTWALAKELYSFDGPYFIVPLSLLLGASLTTIQALLHRIWPNLWFLDGSTLMLPVVFMYSSIMTFGITSSIISSILVGIICQLWIRNRWPVWFNDHSLIFGSALDGGAQCMLLLLSFTVLGGIEGSHKPFWQWVGNPVVGNVDYCNGNGALDR
ncbi:peptide transporter MTD1 [Coprinopsis cinerea okayama7|uniref:Peptide transporter MTD1 n=1 Tax=Coprinopsis cinerea (strain Okayama-7 / 130 / ATCC MYA-4618 / FGSC 9003) TaxID=240176 RepID=A8NBK3_COPC7|nr:peptide transporter MTD1 [Coprinopsis cinerea okayama7\|eukprot:XP_001832201.2 peptide transporter MTD1 [Coprinopsis cinerea okayama7\